MKTLFLSLTVFLALIYFSYLAEYLVKLATKSLEYAQVHYGKILIGIACLLAGAYGRARYEIDKSK